MDQRLPFGPDAGRRDPFADLRTRARPFLGQCLLDRSDAALGRRGRDALLSESPRVGRVNRRRRQGVEPVIVLAPDEMEGAAVEPGDDERAIVERPLDASRGESRRSRPEREPEAAWILRLHREQSLGDGNRIACRRPGEELRLEALGEHAPIMAQPGLRRPGSGSEPGSVGFRPSPREGGWDERFGEAEEAGQEGSAEDAEGEAEREARRGRQEEHLAMSVRPRIGR